MSEIPAHSMQPANGPETAIVQGMDIQRLSLNGVAKAAQGFYGARDTFFGKTLEGEHRIIASLEQHDGTLKRETIGAGMSPEATMHDTLDKMRSLETAETKPLVRLQMTPDASVTFSTLEHYAPKSAPATEAYAVPSYLQEVLSDDRDGQDTYRKTVAEAGWQDRVLELVDNYTKQPNVELLDDLEITSLEALTPEQAIKLSLGVVQGLSKYSFDAAGNPGGEREDQLTTTELLTEGLQRKGDPSWQGNGVCRNVAANVKSVFEALQAKQGAASMLRNTYCVFEGGYSGAGYNDARQDFSKTKLNATGHAWNKFVTIDGNGSASITKVDATWALENDAASAMAHMDYTLPRIGSTVRELFADSSEKVEAFYDVSHYYDQLLKQARGKEKPGNTDMEQAGSRMFAVAEYLRAAADALPAFAEQSEAALPLVPNGVTTTCYQMKDRLSEQEVATLFGLSKLDMIDNFDTILGSYVHGDTQARPGWQKIERLVQADDELQQKIFEALGSDALTEHAQASGKFRNRLRELDPKALPAFNPYESAADKNELRYLAQQVGVNEFDPDKTMQQLHRQLKQAAGNNEELYKLATVGRSDYEFVKHFGRIKTATKQAAEASMQ